MDFRRVSTVLLALLLALSSALLVLALPNWPLALPTLAFAVALALAFRRSARAYSVALLGLFLLFLFAVIYVVGDAEEPTLSYLATPRYFWLALVSATNLLLAWVFKRAQGQHRAEMRSMSKPDG